jgi:hypothetical protein
MGADYCLHDLHCHQHARSPGAGRPATAFTCAALEGGFAGLPVIMSAAIGAAIDRYRFTVVCLAVPWLPIAGLVMLTVTLSRRPGPPR